MRLKKLLLTLLLPLLIVGLTAQRFPNRRFNAPSSYLSFLQSTGPIAIWTLDDPDTVARNYGTLGSAANGTHTGITPGQPGIAGRASALYDGANDVTDVGNASVIANFNGSEGAAMAWGRIPVAGVWADSAIRMLFHFDTSSGTTSAIRAGKTTIANQLYCAYAAGGTNEQITIDGITTTGWFCVVGTWSKSGDLFTVYYNGASVGTSGTLGNWTGSLSADYTTIGAFGPVSGIASRRWSGWLQFVTLWNRALTPGEVSQIYAKAFQSADLDLQWDWLTPEKRLAKVLTFPKVEKTAVKTWRKAA